MNYFKLAWRNLWRNKRRTLITVASIFFGVYFAVFTSSLQKGSFENMVENMVRFYSGYIQIQNKKFKENPSVNNSFNDNEYLRRLIEKNKLITQYTQRIESFVLASTGEKSYGAIVFGIIPEMENNISQLSKWVCEGNYLKTGSNGVLVGKELAANLEININDTIVLLGQGYHGATAAGMYPVTGLLDFPLAEMSKQIIYMEMETCRNLYSLNGRSTSIVIMVESAEDVQATIDQIKPDILSKLKIYSWNEIQEELDNLIEGKLASGKIIKGILFMVIGFGIWGTIIMLMAERKRELGIMIALGVKKLKMVWIIAIESFFIGLLGILIGFVGSLPLVIYLYNNPIRVGGQIKQTYEQMGFEPIIKFSVHPDIFIDPAITVFILFAIITLYPVWYVFKLKTADALRA
jgi:ABC-type lipoprotein release transport system permease subunit